VFEFSSCELLRVSVRNFFNSSALTRVTGIPKSRAIMARLSDYQFE
jgi:hypothetical protein